jgi:hypothetical protein
MLENPTVQQLKIAFLSELLDELSDPEIIHNAVLYVGTTKKIECSCWINPKVERN